MEDGHDLAHAFAKGWHDKEGNKYSYEETEKLWERKNEEREKNPKLGWPKCETIKGSGCKHCENCEHFGKITSPLNLALKSSRQAEAPEHKLFQPSAEFVAGYVPPDYLIDGLLQRRYVYSFTAKTGDGKTAIALLLAFYVAKGRALAGREVEKGRVLFFAGENPDDVRTRWILLCEALK